MIDNALIDNTFGLENLYLTNGGDLVEIIGKSEFDERFNFVGVVRKKEGVITRFYSKNGIARLGNNPDNDINKKIPKETLFLAIGLVGS